MTALDQLRDFFDRSRVTYRVIHHPIVYTSQELAAVLGVKGRQFAKVVVLWQDATPTLTVLPADHRIDFAQLPRLRLASETEIRARFPNCAAGAVPPFGSLFGADTLVDETLSAADEIAFEAGTHTDAMKMQYADFERLEKPRRAKFAFKAS